MEYEERPWGNYTVLADMPDHKVKRIVVNPGKRLSYQRHNHRAEHWYILKGNCIVTLNGEDHPLKGGQAIDLPQGAWHRIKNSGDKDVVFIEVQTGSYFGEDDIERSEDDFGRV